MRNWMPRRWGVVAAVVALGTLTACSGDSHMSGPDASGTVALLAVAPANGATGVSITMPMAMRFSGPLGAGMERYIVIHEGSVAGATVAGRWTWSDDRRTLTFTPDAPLRPHTTYVIHMGGGLQGQNAMPLDYGSCLTLGGRTVTGGMMGGAGAGMMGPGWQAADGGYGMIFTFATA